MIRRPPRSTRTDTLFPYTTLFRSAAITMNARLAMMRRSKRVAYLPTSGVSSTGNTPIGAVARPAQIRSEEHTSELQSLMHISYAVFCLKKKKNSKLTHKKKVTNHKNTTDNNKYDIKYYII